MRYFTLDIARQFRDARRARGLTQAALAQAAGCTQSAVSMMELGRADAVSCETLQKIAAMLEIPFVSAGDESPQKIGSEPPSQPRGVCCPQAECPSNIPFAIGASLSFWPTKQSPNQVGDYCVCCGEVLLKKCPACHAALNEGAHCRQCGTNYVNQPAVMVGDAVVWAVEQRQRIAEWRALALGARV